jgi:hypothetical protein
MCRENTLKNPAHHQAPSPLGNRSGGDGDIIRTSGLPISILSGKPASDRAIKVLEKRKQPCNWGFSL